MGDTGKSKCEFKPQNMYCVFLLIVAYYPMKFKLLYLRKITIVLRENLEKSNTQSLSIDQALCRNTKGEVKFCDLVLRALKHNSVLLCNPFECHSEIAELEYRALGY